MLLSQLIKDLKYESVNFTDYNIAMIAYDSRRAVEDSLFVCLNGVRADGHNYAQKAYDLGCRAFLCERKLELPEDAVQIIIENTRKGLAVVSAEFFGRPADSLKIVGITGTKGKTTTALMALEILNKAGINTAYIGSNGVIINGRHTATVNTTPESYDLHYFFKKMVVGGITTVVMEVSSQALKNYRVYGIKFCTAVYLNLSQDHIGVWEHPDFEDYLKSKAKLFTNEYLHGNAIYNADDPRFIRVVGKSSIDAMTFGIREKSDITAGEIVSYRDSNSLGVEFNCYINEKRTHFKIMVPGEFNVYNALAATAISAEFGVSADFCAHVLENTPVSGRFEIVSGIKNRTFIIDYAHNEISLMNALKTLRSYNPSRLICLFGSVGGRSQSRRAELGAVASELADICIITSDNPDFEPPEDIINDIVDGFIRNCPFYTFINREEAIRYVVRESKDGDIILFAGKGHETYQLIEGKKVPFSEREIILDECEKIRLQNMEKTIQSPI